MIADEDEILRLAAGDAEALYLLGCNVMDGSLYEYPITDAERFAKAEAFARLASANGDAQGLLLLGAAMAARAGVAVSPAAYEMCRNEAVAALRAAMDAGHPEAALRLAHTLTVMSDLGDELAEFQLLDLMQSIGSAEAACLKEQVAALLAESTLPGAVPQADPVPEKLPVIEPLTRRERLRFWLSNIQWTLQCLGWAFADLWRAIRGKY